MPKTFHDIKYALREWESSDAWTKVNSMEDLEKFIQSFPLEFMKPTMRSTSLFSVIVHMAKGEEINWSYIAFEILLTWCKTSKFEDEISKAIHQELQERNFMFN